MSRHYDPKITAPNNSRKPHLIADEAWIVEFLSRAQIGHIATRWNETPFINPTTFWYDPSVHTIYFHSNVAGRIRANSERHPEVCFEASEFGKLLPSNVALEFSMQYHSVIAFGLIRVLTDDAEKQQALSGLIGKYFPTMAAGSHYRPITTAELTRTSVYAIEISSWSGKQNWPDRADQSDEWPPLDESWFT
jgi:nitroimidazol reductase NimA-like FMN-containing flavoprotein (pyridoxamine 5'-phosphate oxidase superfamily)